MVPKSFNGVTSRLLASKSAGFLLTRLSLFVPLGRMTFLVVAQIHRTLERDEPRRRPARLFIATLRNCLRVSIFQPFS
jgi:hypothetical protein